MNLHLHCLSLVVCSAIGVNASLLPVVCFATDEGVENAAKSEPMLTIDRIFGGSEFTAKQFSGHWDKEQVEYLMTEDAAAGGRDIVAYDPQGDSRKLLVAARHLVAGETTTTGSRSPLAIEDFQFSRNRQWVLIFTNTQRVWRQHTRGDYWVFDRAAQQLRQLGRQFPSASLMFAQFSPTADHVAYVHDRDIYVEHLASGTVRRLTQAESTNIINGTFDWVYEEEFSLRDGMRWSPDGRRIAFWQIDTAGVPEVTLINNTDSLYPTTQAIKYPKVGQQNPSCRIGVVDIDADANRVDWVELPDFDRDSYIARMDWAGATGDLLLQHLNRLQNRLTLYAIDGDTPDARVVLTETDEAWLDVCDDVFWIDGGTAFTWLSERSGWRHLFVVDMRSGDARQVTTGEWDVIEVLAIDREQNICYFLASPENATQAYLYQTQLDGTHLQRLTPADQPGSHHYQLSSDAKWAIHTYSRFGVPPVVDLVRLPDHQSVKVLVENRELQDKLAALSLGETSFLRVPVADGVELDGWQILPTARDGASKWPVLVHVYGEPAGQTVVDRWGGANYLWHQLLAQRGYVVLSFDNRGTPAPRGRNWRKCVYRQIGVLAARDQADAITHTLKNRSEFDADRVGIWGWSGGGSMTLNAMFRYPDIYHTGISVAPVPNQRYYDTIYQERYMGLPDDNADGYMAGSPIHHAKNLQGDLLIIHGTGDDNCHYQTTELLINELIRLDKSFSMMAYPNRSHSIREGENTTVHLRRLMTRFLEDNL